MARVSGRRQSEREVPCIDDGWDRDSLVPVFPNTFTNVADSESERGGVGCVERKELFTVRVKDGRQYTSERLLSEKLEVFVEDLQLNAHLLKLVDPEEVIVRLVLVGSDGDNRLELEGALTLGDVRMCMVVDDVLEAVLAKTTPPATVSSVVQGQTNITEHVTDTQGHNQLYPASAYANAPTWVVNQSDDRALMESLTGQRKRRSSSLWASMAPSLPVVPSWSEGTSWLPSGNNSEQDHLALINAINSLPGVPEFSDSSSNSNASASLGISSANLQRTGNEHGLVRWPRRRDHGHQTYFGEALDFTMKVLQEAGEFLASLQRLEQRSVDQGNADLAGARGEIIVQREGNEVVETCMSELL